MTHSIPNREAFPQFLNDQGLTGEWVELGVFKGDFSDLLLKHGKCKRLYSIDRWAGDRGHNDAEYWHAYTKLHRHGVRSMTLKMSFDSAVQFFKDEQLDFVYLDGYAHTGQDDGQHFDDWLAKIKPGGIFAGHDYSTSFQPTIDAVDAFVKRVGVELHLTGEEKGIPSWWIQKPK